MRSFPVPRVRPLALAIAAWAVAGVASDLAAQSRRGGDGGSFEPAIPDGAMRPLPLVRRPVFFPPIPPALGRPISRVPPPADGRPPAPPALAPYVNEIFYPMLAARLASNSLKEPLPRQLNAYRVAKLALQNELSTELQRLRGAEPAARATALATLARAQAQRLAQLEKDAEQLRRDLLLGDHTWGALREWRLGDRERRGFSPVEIAQVMRAYAFFQNGLLPAQRRLLREIALELLMAAENQEKAAASQPHIFFPPEPARVSFPENMPAEAAAKLALFQTKKSALKKELYDAVYRHDGATFAFLTGHSITSLANKQSARLAEFEALAEDVRRLLTREVIRAAAPPSRSPLTATLNARLAVVIARYSAAQKSAVERIDAILARAKDLPLQSTFRFDPEGLKFLVVPTRFAARQPETLKKIEAVRAEISAVAEDFGRTLAELLNERAAIREDAARDLNVADAARLDALLMSAMRATLEQEAAPSYDEYRIAVFEPGLSPEQRRVLFDRVIEQLDLPLPRGEFQPIRRTDTW